VNATIMLSSKTVWKSARDADGGVRHGGDIAELTDLSDPAMLGMWPAGDALIVSRERPIPAHNVTSRTGRRLGHIELSSPTTPNNGRSWKHATGDMPVLRTGSAHAKDSGLGGT